MGLLFTEISTHELRKLQKCREDYKNLYKRTLELEKNYNEVVQSNNTLIEFLDAYKMANWKQQETITSLIRKCEYYEKKYKKYLQKYKDVMNK